MAGCSVRDRKDEGGTFSRQRVQKKSGSLMSLGCGGTTCGDTILPEICRYGLWEPALFQDLSRNANPEFIIQKIRHQFEKSKHPSKIARITPAGFKENRICSDGPFSMSLPVCANIRKKWNTHRVVVPAPGPPSPSMHHRPHERTFFSGGVRCRRQCQSRK